jgi:hypothetical protein
VSAIASGRELSGEKGCILIRFFLSIIHCVRAAHDAGAPLVCLLHRKSHSHPNDSNENSCNHDQNLFQLNDVNSGFPAMPKKLPRFLS